MDLCPKKQFRAALNSFLKVIYYHTKILHDDNTLNYVYCPVPYKMQNRAYFLENLKVPFLFQTMRTTGTGVVSLGNT